MDTRERKGVMAAIASSMLGGTAVAATRSVVVDIEPILLVLLRYGIGVACLLPLAVLSGYRGPVRRDFGPTILLGLLFFALFPWLFTMALAYTTAGRGALVLSTLPMLTLLFATIFGAESISGTKVAGVLVALGGVAVALSGGWTEPVAPPDAWIGDLLMGATAACGAVYNVFSRPYLRRYPALAFTASAMLAGTVGLGLITAGAGLLPSVTDIAPGTWGGIAYLGIFGAALAFLLWSWALERTTPTRVAVTVTVNPVVATILGAFLLGEPASGNLFVGLAAIGIGVLLTTRGRR